MRKEFIATITRLSGGDLKSEHHDSREEALRDLVGYWDGSDAKTIAGVLLDESDDMACLDILVTLLMQMEVDSTTAQLCQEPGPNGGAGGVKMLGFLHACMRQMPADTLKNVLGRFGYTKK